MSRSILFVAVKVGAVLAFVAACDPSRPQPAPAPANRGFGAIAEAPAEPPSSPPPSTPSPDAASDTSIGPGTRVVGAPGRTWQHTSDLTIAIGSDFVDVTSPSAFHVGADLPVLTIGDRTHSSSTFVSPNVIRFAGTGAIAPTDEIAIRYGKGTPTVLRKGAAR